MQGLSENVPDGDWPGDILNEVLSFEKPCSIRQLALLAHTVRTRCSAPSVHAGGMCRQHGLSVRGMRGYGQARCSGSRSAEKLPQTHPCPENYTFIASSIAQERCFFHLFHIFFTF